jgi:hypothetical protein
MHFLMACSLGLTLLEASTEDAKTRSILRNRGPTLGLDNSRMSIPINQIRHLQTTEPGKPFALELVSGRIIQIYDPASVATCESGHGSIGVLHSDGCFEVFPADRVASVSVGLHPVEEERRRKRREEVEKRFGKGGGDAKT